MAAGGPAVVLASGSAARKTLLAASGVACTVQPAAVDEGAIKRTMQAGGAAPEAVAAALASAKAWAIDAPGAIVIGADQILVCDGEWFDKPGDADGVMEHLLRLRGRSHTLVTAVSCWLDGSLAWGITAQPVLAMRDFSDAFLQAYLAVEAPAVGGCVGGYRLEGLGLQLFERIEGEYAAILGLPMLDLLAFLRRSGVLLA